MQNSSFSTTSYANTLMVHYCLELQEHSAQYWLDRWLEEFPIHWITLAVIEALYLGRYKAVSVEQILVNWKRRGRPSHHFTHEFERVISRRFPRSAREMRRQRGTFPSSERAATQPLEVTVARASVVEDAAVDTELPGNSHLSDSISYNLKSQFTEVPPSEPEPVNLLAETAPEEPKEHEEEIFTSPLDDLKNQFISAIQLHTLGQPDTSNASSPHPIPTLGEPIVQFVPDPVHTLLYDKLKSISQVRDQDTVTTAMAEKKVAEKTATEEQELNHTWPVWQWFTDPWFSV